jgi:DNA-binding CsgD family transcriptional regulator/tetratricopeptide (TPR) repeat protein
MIGPVVRRVSSSIFVGRVAERAHLEAGLDAAVQREPGFVLLGGDAGIGKTRLANELATLAGSRGVLVVRGRCHEANASSMPFAPFIEILRALLLEERISGYVAANVTAASALARLVPELEPQAAMERRPASEDERATLFHAVLGLLGHAAQDRPVLAVVEDLHWSDASSLDLLRFIAEGLVAQRLLIVATFRTDELHHRHPLPPLLGELGRLPHVVRLDLPAFTDTEVADQLTGIAGTRPTAEVIRRVFARSDGNPFFVEELVGHGADANLPATLHDILAARLARLSPDGRTVVRAAAAIGRDAKQELIAQVSSVPQERLFDALREAIDHHVLVEADPRTPADFAFRHALIQELAYTELLPSERIALHLTIMRSLETAGGAPGEIAHHALIGQDVPTALKYSIDAADAAIEALALAEALSHLELALDLWTGVDEPESLIGRDQASLLVAAAHCAGGLGQWSRAVELGRMALSHLDKSERREGRIVVLLDLSRWEMLDGNEVGRAAVIQEAADLVPTHPPSALRARVLGELSHLATGAGRVEDARRLAEEAIEMSRAIGARAEEMRGLLRLAQVFGTLGQPETAEHLLDEAERFAAEGHAPSEDFVGHIVFRKADCALASGAFARAIDIIDAGMARATRVGRFGERAGFLRLLKIYALAALGRWREAELLAHEVERDMPWTARMAVQNYLDVLIRQGRVAKASAAVRATDVGYVSAEEGADTLGARIQVALGEHRWDDARAAADEAIALFKDPSHESGALFIAALGVAGEADWAELAHRRRRSTEEAEARRVGLARLDLLRHGAQEAIGLGGAGPLIEAVLATAEAEGTRLRGRPDEARWAEAADRREALGQPWETAYAHFRHAEAMLGEGGRKLEAVPVLRDAHRIALQLGASPLVEQIEDLARRARIRLAAAPPERRERQATTPEGVVVALTTREWEVLSLVAAGHTNREIGADLFISEKTASVHITNAMDKLGALSRYDAAGIASRLGLLDVNQASASSPGSGGKTKGSTDVGGLIRAESQR